MKYQSDESGIHKRESYSGLLNWTTTATLMATAVKYFYIHKRINLARVSVTRLLCLCAALIVVPYENREPATKMNM